jgi:protein-S-isoprenylcysteine O-methyltransferase Ste14
MTSYFIAFLITALIWIIPELWLLFRDRKIKPQEVRNNGRFAYLLFILAIITCVLFTNNSLTIPLTQDNRFLTGTLIIWGGLFIRWWAIYSLGKYFKIVVTSQSDQKIVKNGPYKYVHLPSYTGSMIIFVGFGFSLVIGSGSQLCLFCVL